MPEEASMRETETEIEAKFVVTGTDPESIFYEIADAAAMDDYLIKPKGGDIIEDSYFDTEHEALAIRKWALRLRKTSRQTLITLKGPGESLRQGIISRFEFERPWSEESFTSVCRLLKDRGIIEVPHAGLGLNDPREVLIESGFRLVHERQTTRRSFDILESRSKGLEQACSPVQQVTFKQDEKPESGLASRWSPGSDIAELDFDKTRFLFGNVEILHYEIEIEAVSEAGISALEAISDCLKKTYAKNLISWNHGKLATGKALGRLLSSGLLEVGETRPLTLGASE